jgi:16S rRNA (guanine(966)-N(2))-methyltransferase RsmD
MRIFDGTAKGRWVNAPKGVEIRPTTDRTRLALFNAMGALVPGSVFLDLFCGSGSVGLEALSRGAAKVIFIDSKAPCVDAAKATALQFGFEASRFEAWRSDHARGLNQLAGRGVKLDLAFMDPPYDAGLGKPALEALMSADLMKRSPDSRVILEHRGDDASPEVPGLTLYKRYEHGAASVSVYGLEGA